MPRPQTDADVPSKPSILFAYWGRRGISRLVFEVCKALDARQDVDWHLSISEENTERAIFDEFGERVSGVRTFARSVGVLAYPLRARAIEREMSRLIARVGVTDVVTLMPHVWSSILRQAAKRTGARYHTVIHDAAGHPGDLTGLLNPLLLRDAARADGVFTLSDAVLRGLHERRIAPAEKTTLLYHPVSRIEVGTRRPPEAGESWRFLFAGRILPYKGLPLLVDALRIVRNAGIAFDLTVMGEGDIRSVEDVLSELGARVVNRWVSNDEMTAAFRDHHALMLPYLEASQSGPAAQALAASMPIIATNVGGLREQVWDGETGLLAPTDPQAFADRIVRLASDPDLYASLVRGADHRAEERSYERFVSDLLVTLSKGRAPATRAADNPVI